MFLGCVLVFVGAIRFRLREMPLERDEGEYAYAGQLFLQGVSPGRLAYTIKLPGTHAAYAVMMLLFGQSCTGVHLGFLAVNCGTIVLIFLLGRALIGALAGCVAAAIYGLMALSGEMLGTAAHATHFVVLTALAGLLLLWQASKNARIAVYLASGFLLSISVLMKHNGLLFVAFGAVWLACVGCYRRMDPNGGWPQKDLMFFLGVALPFLFLLLLLWITGTLKTCWFWSVTYARAYAKPNPGIMLVWRIMMQRMPHVLELSFPVASLGVASLWLKRSLWPRALFTTGFFLFSLVSVVPGLHFREHYYVLLIPALALGCGALVQQATDFLNSSRFKWLMPIPALTFALFFGKEIARERSLLFQMTPVEVCRSLYGYQPFPEALVLADYIRAHAAPDAQIAVLGSEPEIYFYAHRRSATGYIYTYPLTEHQPFAAQMQEEMKQEIQSAQPQFVVQVRTWTSWLSRPGGLGRIDALCGKLMPPNYKLIGTCDVFPDEPRVVWDWHPKESEDLANSSKELLVFERISAVEQKAD